MKSAWPRLWRRGGAQSIFSSKFFAYSICQFAGTPGNHLESVGAD